MPLRCCCDYNRVQELNNICYPLPPILTETRRRQSTELRRRQRLAATIASPTHRRRPSCYAGSTHGTSMFTSTHGSSTETPQGDRKHTGISTAVTRSTVSDTAAPTHSGDVYLAHTVTQASRRCANGRGQHHVAADAQDGARQGQGGDFDAGEHHGGSRVANSDNTHETRTR